MKFKISAKELENLIPASSILSEQKASKEEVEEGGKVSIRVDRGQGFTYDLDVKAKEFTVSGAPDKFKRIVGKRKISATKLPKAYRRIMDTLQSLYKVSSDDDVFKAAEKEVSGGAEEEKAKKAAKSFKNPPNTRSLKGKTSIKIVDAITKAFQANPKSYGEMLDIFREKEDLTGGMSVEPETQSESFIRQMVKEAIRDLNEQGLSELSPEVDQIVDILKDKVKLDFELGSEEGDMSTEEHLSAFFSAIDANAWNTIKKYLKTRDTVGYASLMSFLIKSHGGAEAKGEKKEKSGRTLTDSQRLRLAQDLATQMVRDLNMEGVFDPSQAQAQGVLDAIVKGAKGLSPTEGQKLFDALKKQVSRKTDEDMMTQIRNTDGDNVEQIELVLKSLSVGKFKAEDFE
tara:strand:- start:694 stop:1896 length:1203 start_codon:yes stop_codon:yes gene_type:complete